MNNQEIIKELCNFLPPAILAELQLLSTLNGENAICVCGTVNKVIQTYNDTPENEERVSILLGNFCKNHFRQAISTISTGKSANQKILKELKSYFTATSGTGLLPAAGAFLVAELELNGVLTGQYSIVLCATVSKIIYTYNSTAENNYRVAILLGGYCKNHFNKNTKTK